MIQRVQSIYLLLVTVIMSFLLVRPYAELTLADNQMLIFKAHAIVSQSSVDVITVYKSTIPVILLVLITSLLSFVAIFFYNHRVIQMRIGLLNALLLAILMIIMLAYYFITRHHLDIADQAFRIPVIFPVVCFILSLMATRAIHNDEMLVNSYNRIR